MSPRACWALRRSGGLASPKRMPSGPPGVGGSVAKKVVTWVVLIGDETEDPSVKVEVSVGAELDLDTPRWAPWRIMALGRFPEAGSDSEGAGSVRRPGGP